MEIDEYRRMAEVEDDMWYYRALHAHLERELAANLGERAIGLGDRVEGDTSNLPVSGGPSRASHGMPPPRPSGTPVAPEAPLRQVLDAGCGTGGLIRRLAAAHPEWQWTGLDLEPLACEFARSRCSGRIVQGSVAELPFSDETFDALASADVLCQVEDDIAVLREFARVLRPEGALVLNVPAYPWLWSYHDDAVQSRRRFLRRELADKLERAGFRLWRITHWNLLPLPLAIVRRKLLPRPRSGSDVRLYPRPVETTFNLAMAMERAWLCQGRSLPAGSSILAVATKRSSNRAESPP